MLPTAAALFSAYAHAVSITPGLSRPAIIKMTELVRVSQSPVETRVETWLRDNGDAIVRASAMGMPFYTEGLTGGVAWHMSAFEGNRLLDAVGSSTIRTVASTDLMHPAAFPVPGGLSDDRFTNAYTHGDVEFDGRRCYEVRLAQSPRDLGESSAFFEVESGLLAGFRAGAVGGPGGSRLAVTWRDYRTLLGALRPTHTASEVMGVTNVRQLLALEAAERDTRVFEVPGEIRGLM